MVRTLSSFSTIAFPQETTLLDTALRSIPLLSVITRCCQGLRTDHSFSFKQALLNFGLSHTVQVQPMLCQGTRIETCWSGYEMLNTARPPGFALRMLYSLDLHQKCLYSYLCAREDRD